MKANELRIGNWVFDNKQIQITSEQIKLADEGLYKLLPIPLTKEWLLKFGFVPDGYGEYKKGENIVLDNEYTEEGVFYILEADHCLSIEVLHVHQLQNLYFALTEKELTVR